jgi:hypothetical protein
VRLIKDEAFRMCCCRKISAFIRSQLRADWVKKLTIRDMPSNVKGR